MTTTYGKVGVRAKVARKILDAANVTVPVHAGAALPLASPEPIWHSGAEGRGVLEQREFDAPLEAFDIQTEADRFIEETVVAYPGEITLVALGALTNVAQAMSRRPEISQLVKACYFMGAGVTFRDPVPSQLEIGETYQAMPSHNVRCDVEAAQVVFSSSLPMRILTNDVTTALWWDGEPVQRLTQSTAPPENAVVGQLLRVWLDYRTGLFGTNISGTCLHDPLTLAEAVGHSFVDYTPGTIMCSRDGSTSCVPSPCGRHLAATSIDQDRFLEWFSQQILEL